MESCNLEEGRHRRLTEKEHLSKEREWVTETALAIVEGRAFQAEGMGCAKALRF